MLNSILGALNSIYGVFDNISLSVIFALVIFISAVCIILIIDDMQRRKSIYYDPNDWFFHDFNNKFFDMMFTKRADTEKVKTEKAYEVAQKIGINSAEYARNCYVAGIGDSGIKSVVVMRIYGVAVLLVGIILYVLTQIVILPVLCAVIAYLLAFMPQKAPNSAAKRKKFQVEEELPRFVELLSIALQLKMPIDQAIRRTAEKVDNSFSRELLEIMEKSNITSMGWVAALEDMTEKYEVPVLNDFVLNIVSAYTKGVDVYDSVVEQLDSMKKQHLNNLTARAKALDNKIMIPIMAGVLAPIVVMVLLPTMTQINFNI